ncbi:MAG: cytochrome c oxidase accessory protein CcoG [Steroidobacteraceae bacterium]
MNTTPAESDSYYVAHQKVYAREVTGRFARLRTAAVWVLLGLYYLVPWLQWNDRQAVLFDLPARKFYIFGLVLWPQDFVFLTWLLVIAALALFFFTAVGGRMWCGFACPQTVWTEAFVAMERWTEGNRAAQMKLDAARWSANKLLRKGAKQALWLGFALWTGFTFVGYFTPITTLAREVVTFSLGPWELFWVLFYGFATYGNAGFLREQVCKYMCPYARFQSAMFDKDTLIITYDEERGEPRGGRKRGVDAKAAGLGDCIDCTMCVQVCPTGIDIRQGLQYECIACAACVDACDSVMDKMNYPRGLIRYDTQNSLEHKKARLLRPRVIVYGTLLSLLMISFFVALGLRKPIGIDVIRDRNALYRMLDDGRLENVYTVKILNKSEQARRFRVSVNDPERLTIDPAEPTFLVDSGAVYPAAIRVRRDAYEPVGPETIRFTITAVDDPRLTASAEARLLAPAQ